ncbi:MAG: hypothetical protein V4481_04925 [Patescibacteria group bacterium]
MQIFEKTISRVLDLVALVMGVFFILYLGYKFPQLSVPHHVLTLMNFNLHVLSSVCGLLPQPFADATEVGLRLGGKADSAVLLVEATIAVRTFLGMIVWILKKIFGRFFRA